MEKISDHITYAEAIHSSTAKRKNIDNTPNPTQVETMGLTARKVFEPLDRKSTRLNSSHGYISYAVFCLKKKNNKAIKM